MNTRHLVALSIIAIAGCSAAPNAPGAQREAIVGGADDTGDPAIVMETDGEGGGCTAEVISPHIVLTAAHCVQDETSWVVTIDGTDYPALEGHYNPMFDYDGDASFDNGILVMADTLPVTPLPLNRTPLTEAMKGQPVRIVGFGVTSPNIDDYGTRRVANVTLLDFDPNQITVGDVTHAQCDGDSGGPALMVIDGTEVIVGTDSLSANHLNGGCGGDLDTRIDTTTSYIDPFVEMHDPGFLGHGVPLDFSSPPDLAGADLTTTGAIDGGAMADGGSGCAMATGAAPRAHFALLVLVALALTQRRRA